MRWVIGTSFGDMHFDPRTMSLTCGARVTKLAAGQSLVLEMLCRDGSIDTSSHGLATVGRPHDYGSRVLHNHVMRLRRILGPESIVTVRNCGYRIAAQVAHTEFSIRPAVRIIDIGPDRVSDSMLSTSTNLSLPSAASKAAYLRSCFGWVTIIEDRRAQSARVTWDARIVDPRAAERARKLLLDTEPAEIWLDDGMGVRPADLSSALGALTPARRITSAALAASRLPPPLAGLLDAWSRGMRDRASCYDEAISRGLGNTTIICNELHGMPVFETIGAVNALYGEAWRRSAIGAPVERQPDPDFGRNVRDAYLAPMAIAAARSDPATWEPRIERVAATILACPTSGRLAIFDYDRLVLPLAGRRAIACTYIRAAS